MDFDKVINSMQELQSKIEVYELKIKKIDDIINVMNKEVVKLGLRNSEKFG